MLRSVCYRGTKVSTKVNVRPLSSSFRLNQDFPSYDHSQLNPLSRNGSSSKSSELSQSLSHLYSQKEKSNSTNQEFAVYSHKPKDDALSSRLTGVVAGRTVDVFNNDTANACRQLNSMMFANNIAQDKRAQRFYLKPGKVAEMKKSQKHRKDFMKGFKRLIEIVKDAKRKGY